MRVRTGARIAVHDGTWARVGLQIRLALGWNFCCQERSFPALAFASLSDFCMSWSMGSIVRVGARLGLGPGSVSIPIVQARMW